MMAFWTLLAFALALFVLWNVYIRTSKFHALLQKIPGPPLVPLLGNAAELMGGLDKMYQNILVQWPKTYGEIYRFFIGSDAYVCISCPELSEVIYNSPTILDKGKEYDNLKTWLGEGLLTNGGENWKPRRKMITPTFHFKILDSFMDTFNRQSRTLCQVFSDKMASHSNLVEIFDIMTPCTLDIICGAALGCDIKAQTEDSDYYKAVHRISQVYAERMKRPWLANNLIYSMTSLGKEEDQLIKTIHHFTKNVIRQRRSILSSNRGTKTKEENEVGTKSRKPMLDFLLEVSDDYKMLTEKDLQEEIDTILFGGHDTVSGALSWFLYCMATNPEHQENILEELSDIFADEPDRDCTVNDLNEMKYLERCIKETLRLYPSVPFIERVSQDYVTIGDHVIPPGTNITLLITSTHMNPRIYPEPEKFNPDRFLPEENIKRHPYAFVPFSAGSRNCIGQKFAIREMKVVLSFLIRRFRFSMAPGCENPVLAWQLTVKPLEHYYLTVTPRV